MALKQYLPGEHPAGFQGFRVTVTFGWDHLRVEKYFSTKEHPENEAKALAEAEHDKLQGIAASIIHSDRIYKKRLGSGAHIIAEGFRAHIGFSKYRDAESFTFLFIVDSVGRGTGSTSFNVCTGFDDAFGSALALYADSRGLTEHEIAEIKARKPPPEIFIAYLAPQMRQEGHLLTDEEVCSRLGIENTRKMPKKADFDRVLVEIKREKLPVSAYFDKLVLFWRSRVDKVYYKEYLYSEWGGINKCFVAAKSQLKMFEAAERIAKANNSQQIHAAEYVKLEAMNGKLKYRVKVRAGAQRTFTFSQNNHCADTQFHAFRTAVYAAAAMLQGDNLDDLPNWRQFRIYEPGTPPLPEGFFGNDHATIEPIANVTESVEQSLTLTDAPDMTELPIDAVEHNRPHRESIEDVRTLILKKLKDNNMEHLIVDIQKQQRESIEDVRKIILKILKDKGMEHLVTYVQEPGVVKPAESVHDQ